MQQLKIYLLYIYLCFSCFHPPKRSVPLKQKGIQGKVYISNDVGKNAFSPYQIFVLAINQANIQALQNALPSKNIDFSQKRLEFFLPEEHFTEFISAYALSGTDGSYFLDLPPGKYCLFLSEYYPQYHKGELKSAFLKGKIHIELLPEMPTQLDLSWGEAGIQKKSK